MVLLLMRLARMDFEAACGLTVDEAQAWLDVALEIEREINGAQ